MRLSKIKILFFLFLTGVFLLPIFCSAKVVINEIAWMGTKVEGIESKNWWRYEWIELYNTDNESISLDNWKIELYRDKLDFTINLSGTIEKYFLVVASDKISNNYDFNYSNLSGKLNNNGQKIILKNNQGDIIDEINYLSDGWPAGNNNTKQTMERTETGNWQNSQNSGGTPKAKNSSGATEESNEETPPATETPAVSAASNYPPYAEAGPDIVALTNQKLVFDGSKSWDPDWNKLTFFWNFGDGATDTLATTTHSYLYPGQYIAALTVSDGQFSDIDALTVNVFDNSVIISEFSPEQGWIELFNQSNQIANLSSWRLNNFVFPENSLIAPKQYLTLTKEITRLESNGQISLKYPNGSTACQIDYEKDKPNKAMAFDGQNYFWTNLATPGSSNIINLADLENKSYLTTNNPSVQTKPKEEKIALEQKDIFSVKTAETEVETEVETEKETENNKPEQNKEENKYGASLSQAASQAAATNGKKKLILIISIIISASFVFALAIILLKRKIFN